ncbi:MAG: hypothetical protein WC389_22260 [Lutibacter sp.]|jgi:hypothetical protein
MIADLITEFGGDGYMIFFGLLDMMAEDFDEENPGVCIFSCQYLTRNLQVSRQKFIKVLKFLENYPKKNGKIFHEINGDKITLTCNRLEQLSDTWTQKKLRSNLEVTSTLLRPKEGEGEGEKDIKEEKIKEVNTKEKYLCDEKKNDFSQSPDNPIFVTLILEDGFEYPITAQVVEHMKCLYPDVNTEQSFRNMSAWCLNNPTKRKTKRGIKRFYNGWLMGDQTDALKQKGNNNATKGGNNFSDGNPFPGDDY